MKIKFFASLRDRLGVSEQRVDWQAAMAGSPSADLTVAQLRAHLSSQSPEWEAALAVENGVRAAINFEMVDDDALVQAADEVAFFPPVTGG